MISIQQSSNASFSQLIKQAAMDAFKASKPCDTVIGTVTKINPVTVRISQKMTLSGGFLGATQTALASIKKGDKVLMMRQSGGQKYYIIDKVVDEL